MRDRFFQFALVFLCFAASNAAAQTPVSVVAPSTGGTGEVLRFTGNLKARRVTRLSPQVSGLVAKIHADVGDIVAEGDVLVELDERLVKLDVVSAQAALAEAEAALNEATRLAEEGRRLVNDRFIPSTEASAREAGVALAAAARDRARSDVDRALERQSLHRLRAPFGGVISERLVELGEWVDPGSAVVQLVEHENLWLDVQVPQRYWASTSGGISSVRARADVAPDRLLDTQVQARVPVSDPTARTFLVRLLVHDESGMITPGMSAQVEIELNGDEGSTRIPRDALLRHPDGTTSVWLVPADSMTVRERTVEVVRLFGSQAELAGDLPAGSRVVVRGNEGLREGDTVSIVRDQP